MKPLPALLLVSLAGCIPGSSVSGYLFRGRVLDAEGRPVPGATARVAFPPRFESQGNLADELSGNRRAQLFAGATDEAGRFVIEAHAVHHVTFNLPGAILLALTVGPVVAFSPLTWDDVPRWLLWMAAMPPRGPHPWGARISVSRPGGWALEVLLEPRRHEAPGPLPPREAGKWRIERAYDLGDLRLEAADGEEPRLDPGR